MLLCTFVYVWVFIRNIFVWLLLSVCEFYSLLTIINIGLCEACETETEARQGETLLSCQRARFICSLVLGALWQCVACFDIPHHIVFVMPLCPDLCWHLIQLCIVQLWPCHIEKTDWLNCYWLKMNYIFTSLTQPRFFWHTSQKFSQNMSVSLSIWFMHHSNKMVSYRKIGWSRVPWVVSWIIVNISAAGLMHTHSAFTCIF